MLVAMRHRAEAVPPNHERLRVCIVYDCLFPYTVGGAERWYRNLAEQFVRAGHEVTYLTRRQWPLDQPPQLEGLTVVAISRRDTLYDGQGRRSIGPPLRFGAGLLWHLLRNRRRYDVVHTCSFPYFSVLAARVALAGTPVVMGIDWFEVWSRKYWDDYLGTVKGAIGDAIQSCCIRCTRLAFIASRRHGDRLHEKGLRGDAVPIGGLYAPGETEPTGSPEVPAEPLVLFAGRLIPEKRAELVPAVVAALRARHPSVRGVIIGDGPSRSAVEEAIEAAGVSGVVEMLGFVDASTVQNAMGKASCLLNPSVREGYGLVVIEAAAQGTPVVVTEGPDNAAVELIDCGINGWVAPGADPVEIAQFVSDIIERGAEMRESTLAWFRTNSPQLRIDRSSRTVVGTYEHRCTGPSWSARRGG